MNLIKCINIIYTHIHIYGVSIFCIPFTLYIHTFHQQQVLINICARARARILFNLGSRNQFSGGIYIRVYYIYLFIYWCAHNLQCLLCVCVYYMYMCAFSCCLHRAATCGAGFSYAQLFGSIKQRCRSAKTRPKAMMRCVLMWGVVGCAQRTAPRGRGCALRITWFRAQSGFRNAKQRACIWVNRGKEVVIPEYCICGIYIYDKRIYIDMCEWPTRLANDLINKYSSLRAAWLMFNVRGRMDLYVYARNIKECISGLCEPTDGILVN